MYQILSNNSEMKIDRVAFPLSESLHSLLLLCYRPFAEDIDPHLIDQPLVSRKLHLIAEHFKPYPRSFQTVSYQTLRSSYIPLVAMSSSNSQPEHTAQNEFYQIYRLLKQQLIQFALALLFFNIVSRRQPSQPIPTPRFSFHLVPESPPSFYNKQNFPILFATGCVYIYFM